MDESTTNPTELYLHAISLLDTLSSKAPTASPTSQSPPRIPNYHQQTQSSPYLDQLEINLGSIGGSALKYVRKVLNYLYGGEGNFSLRSVVRRIISLYDSLRYGNAIEEAKVKGGLGISKLVNGLGGGFFGGKDEKESVKKIIESLKQAGEAGHSQSWLLLGDLYLVCLESKTFSTITNILN